MSYSLAILWGIPSIEGRCFHPRRKNQQHPLCRRLASIPTGGFSLGQSNSQLKGVQTSNGFKDLEFAKKNMAIDIVDLPMKNGDVPWFL